MEYIAYYAVPAAMVAVISVIYWRLKMRASQTSTAALQEAVGSGLTEPPSLHPVVDLMNCMGSGTCARACPEHALGVIRGKAVLVNPTHCIGHGACAAACPVGAIKLVFGTARRGVDIPNVKPTFETNVPGIFIAGELGGMGLIRKAVEQGKQAMATIVKRGQGSAPYDVIIVGSGPAGIAATLAAAAAGLRYLTIEQEEHIGGTALHYPRNKLVMTAPMDLPLYGKVAHRELTKEELIGIWNDVVAKTGIKINFGTRLDRLSRNGDGIAAVTERGEFRAGSVLLAIGRRGSPRRLGVPGEDHAKVVYRLLEPEQYRGTNALVVGGGDSALEGALTLANEPDTKVILSYRGDAFGRVKPKNRERIHEAERSGVIKVMLRSKVERIAPTTVTLVDQNGKQCEMPNEVVVVCAGGLLPTRLLVDAGIQVETRYGT